MVGSGFHLIAPIGLWRTASVRRRTETGIDTIGALSAARLRDRDGAPWLIGLPENWLGVLAARRHTKPLRAWTRWRLAGPRWIGMVVLMLMLIPLPFHALWWTGHEAETRVVRIVEHKTDKKCEVRWQEEDGEHRALDGSCSSGTAYANQRRNVHVLGWPFRDLLMTGATIMSVSVLCWIPAALLSVIGRIVGWIRLRRTPVELVRADDVSAVATPTGLTGGALRGGSVSIDQGAVSTSANAEPFLALWERAARSEGWFDDAPTPPTPPLRRVAQIAAADVGWWAIGVGLLLIAATNDGWVRWVGMLGVVVVAVAVVRVSTAWMRMTSSRRSAITAQWPYVLVRTPLNRWSMLLLENDEPMWKLDLGHPDHPPLTGMTQVYGKLRHGGRVALVISGVTWHPRGEVQRMDADALTELRLELSAATPRY